MRDRRLYVLIVDDYIGGNAALDNIETIMEEISSFLDISRATDPQKILSQLRLPDAERTRQLRALMARR